MEVRSHRVARKVEIDGKAYVQLDAGLESESLSTEVVSVVSALFEDVVGSVEIAFDIANIALKVLFFLTSLIF